jgi:heme-degrading monooxygenase HmoA
MEVLMPGAKACRWGALVCGALVVVACSSDSNGSGDGEGAVAPTRSELKCHAAVIEPDLESQFIAGSAVDLSAGELQLDDGPEYIVSSTYGIPKRREDGEYLSPRYQQLMGEIVEKLQTQPGLLALQVSSSESCKSGRTLAVWESEELMYDFVTTGPHLEAMSSASELLLPGYAVTHWSASSRDQMTLMAAPKHLEDNVQE